MKGGFKLNCKLPTVQIKYGFGVIQFEALN